LQLADRLSHGVYNVSRGRLTTYGEIVEGITAALPGTRITLPERSDANSPQQAIWLSDQRLLQDTDYRPSYDTPGAVADYITWLRAGNKA
jgi:UDP-glucose 4-epimerase